MRWADPFGYDKNDLNLDHFTQNIIRVELNSITSRPMPKIEDWAFASANTQVFGSHGAPEDWLDGGEAAIWHALAKNEEQAVQRMIL